MKNHRIVHTVTAKYMLQNKKRTLTTFFGIVFMVLLMTCVFVGKDTGLAFMEQVASQKEGKWHISLYDVGTKEREAVQNLPYVKETAISASYGYTDFPNSGNPDRPYLMVKAYSEKCFSWMNVSLSEGRFPQNGNEIIVSKNALTDGAELHIGDILEADFFQRSITGIDSKTEKTILPLYKLELDYGETLAVPENFPYYGENESFRENQDYTGRKHTYEVVGFMEQPFFESSHAAGYAALTGLSQEDLKGLQTYNLSLTLDLKKAPENFGVRFCAIADENDTEVDFNNYVLSFSGNSSDTTINRIVQFMVFFFVGLIMLASVVLIYNVFNISFQERSQYLGMLSSVGATKKQKRSSIYFEALTLLLPAIPVGLFLGMGVIKLGLMALRPSLGKFMGLEQYVKDVPITLSVSMEELMVVILVSTVTVLISSFLPARKIGKIGPIASIRGLSSQKNRPYSIQPRLIKCFGAEAMLARNSTRRQKKKTRSIVAAAFSFLVIIAVTSFGAETMKSVVRARLEGGNAAISTNLDRWNYCLRMHGDGSRVSYEALQNEIRELSSVSNYTEEWNSLMYAGHVSKEIYSQEYWDDYHEIFNLYYRRVLSEEEFSEYSGTGVGVPIHVLSVDDETMRVLAKSIHIDPENLLNEDTVLTVMDGDLSTELISVWGMEPKQYRYYHVEHMTDRKPGENIQLQLYSPENDKHSELSLTVAGEITNEQLKDYVSFYGENLWLIVNKSVGEKIRRLTQGDQMPVSETFFRWDGQDTALFQISEACESMNDVYLSKLHSSKQLSDAIVDIVNILLGCFVALTSVICLLNLFNSIRGRMEERRGDFAILKSVGMTDRQLRKMLLLENGSIIIKSLFLAVIVSVPLIALVYLVLEKIFGHIVLLFPTEIFILAAVIVFLAVLVITQYSLSKEKNIDLLSNIRKESM